MTDQHPGATCKTLAAEDIGEGLPSEVQCLCGCGGCAARCDGVGPVLGVVTGDMQASYPPIVRIDKYIPDRGTIGLYVRLRGLTNAGVLVCNTDDCNPPLAQYYLVTPLTTEFVEQILFDDPFVGQAAYSWDKPEDKPQFLAILPVYGTKTEPVPTLFEMDCIVPFVLPH